MDHRTRKYLSNFTSETRDDLELIFSRLRKVYNLNTLMKSAVGYYESTSFVYQDIRLKAKLVHKLQPLSRYKRDGGGMIDVYSISLGLHAHTISDWLSGVKKIGKPRCRHRQLQGWFAIAPWDCRMTRWINKISHHRLYFETASFEVLVNHTENRVDFILYGEQRNTTGAGGGGGYARIELCFKPAESYIEHYFIDGNYFQGDDYTEEDDNKIW